MLARASKSIRPLDEVAENLRVLLAAETAGPGR
ncbi:Uncharacterised protein [Mycobacteroides abscessus subsp. abscessus]|nr:Uncharacterised protein [Mycobacteroides abscessus subsp. abscessus]